MKRQKRIVLNRGATATVDHDCPQETIDALNAMVEVAFFKKFRMKAQDLKVGDQFKFRSRKNARVCRVAGEPFLINSNNIKGKYDTTQEGMLCIPYNDGRCSQAIINPEQEVYKP